MKYPVQKCSFCKGEIYHYDDRKEEPEPNECKCNNRGNYYVKSGLTSDSSGISQSEFDNYFATKIDQEHL